MQTRTPNTARVLLLALLTLTAGCGWIYEFGIGVRNMTAEERDHVEVQFGPLVEKFGVLGVGSTAVNFGTQAPVPDVGVVRWESRNGVRHQKGVAVRRAVPRGFRDDVIFFDIEPGEIVMVRVQPRPGKGRTR